MTFADRLFALVLLIGCSPFEGVRLDDAEPRSLGVGASAACFIDARDGLVYCFGTNAHGLLGRAVPLADGPLPILLDGRVIEAVTDLDVHIGYACAVSDGRLICWGTIPNGGGPRPVDVTSLFIIDPAGRRAVGVALSSTSVCISTETNAGDVPAIRCRRWDAVGRGPQVRGMPSDFTAHDAVENFELVENLGCWLASDGSVYCFPTELPTTAALCTNPSCVTATVVGIYASGDEICAYDTDAQLWSAMSAETPISVAGVADSVATLPESAAGCSGTSSVCRLLDGELKCWNALSGTQEEAVSATLDWGPTEVAAGGFGLCVVRYRLNGASQIWCDREPRNGEWERVPGIGPKAALGQ